MMVDDRDADAFLDAEKQAILVATQLERLMQTLTRYKASADEFTAAGEGLATLAGTQHDATAALNGLIAELRRVGIEETQGRLDKLRTDVGRVATSVAVAQKALTVVKRIAMVAAVAAVLGLGLLAWLVSTRI